MQESSLRVLIACTIFLKQATAAGLCLAEIGEKMTRDICRGEESSSVLEIICNKAKESVVGGTDDDDYSSECNEVKAELECGIFQFDDESECKTLPDMLHQHVPLFTRVPSIAANLSALMRCPPNLWITTYDKVANNENDTNREEDRRDRSIVRSKSHPSCVNHDAKEGVYFGDMSADGWEMFWHSFQMLLPEALEGSTSKGPKSRFGSSCKF